MVHPSEHLSAHLVPHEIRMQLPLVDRVGINLQTFLRNIPIVGIDIENHGYHISQDASGLSYMSRFQDDDGQLASRPMMVIIPGTLQAPEYYLPHAASFQDDYDVVVIDPATIHREKQGWEERLEQSVSNIVGARGKGEMPVVLWGESAGGASSIKIDEMNINGGASMHIDNQVLSRTAIPHSPAWRRPISVATGFFSFLAHTLQEQSVTRIARGNPTNGRRHLWRGANQTLEQQEATNMIPFDSQLRNSYYVPLAQRNLPTQDKETVYGHMTTARNATRRRPETRDTKSKTRTLIMHTPHTDAIIKLEDVRRLEDRFENHVTVAIPSVYGHNGFFTSVGREILTAASFLSSS